MDHTYIMKNKIQLWIWQCLISGSSVKMGQLQLPFGSNHIWNFWKSSTFFLSRKQNAQNDECFIAIVCWVAMSGDITLSLDVLGIYQDVQIQHCYTCRSYYEAAATKMSMPFTGKGLHQVEIYEPSYAQLLDINLLARLPASNIPAIKNSWRSSFPTHIEPTRISVGECF